MAKAIQQTVKFGVPPGRLFDIYMNSKKHAAAVGSRASIGRGVGGRFSVFDGYITGKNLLIVPKRLVVQSWRGSDWPAGEPDSILVLTFSKARGGGQIDLVHANVPARERAGVTAGWRTYYWTPWRAYLRRTRGRRR